MAGSYALYRCAVLSTSSGSLSGILDRDSPIQILHLNVFMEQQEFADGLEISNEEYCNWRREHLDSDVSTTPPSSEDLLRTFQYLVGQGYHEAIVTTLSHKLSDSADMLRQVAEQVPQLKVHVVDTGTCCMPEGFCFGSRPPVARRKNADGNRCLLGKFKRTLQHHFRTVHNQISCRQRHDGKIGRFVVRLVGAARRIALFARSVVPGRIHFR